MKNFTIEDALCWGLCLHHFNEFERQSKWSGKAVHLVLCIAEALPIIGQIASLFELVVRELLFRPKFEPESKSNLRSYSRPPLSPPVSGVSGQAKAPAPFSCRPNVVLIKNQERASDACRYWPSDLKLLGISEAQKQKLDSHLAAAEKSRTIDVPKKKLKYSVDLTPVSVSLPFTLAVFKTESCRQYFILLKKVFASGGERKIRWAYNVTTGEFVLKKRIVGVVEKLVITYMQQQREARGVGSHIFIRESVDKLGKMKAQVIEPMRDGTVSLLFGKEPFEHFSTKVQICRDLLEDLGALHREVIPGMSFPLKQKEWPCELVTYSVPPYQAYHLDGKFENTLVFWQDQKWRAELCDFGGPTANPTMVAFSVGFTPPEYIKFYQTFRPHGIDHTGFSEDPLAVVNFNLKNGQKRDIWSVGLILLAIAVGRKEKVTFPAQEGYRFAEIAPLPSLIAMLHEAPHSSLPASVLAMGKPYREEGIVKLKQATLDREIDQLHQEAKRKHSNDGISVDHLFRVIQQMLRIEPKERKGVNELLALFEG